MIYDLVSVPLYSALKMINNRVDEGWRVHTFTTLYAGYMTAAEAVILFEKDD